MATAHVINNDTISQPANNPIEGGDTIAATSATVQSTTTDPIATTNTGSSNGLVGWIGIAISIAIGIVAWKVYVKLTDEIQKIKEDLSNKDAQLSQKLEAIDTLSNEIKSINQSLKSVSQCHSEQIVETSVKECSRTNNTVRELVKPQQRQLQVKYATLQSPDDNGVLRFSERSMVDTPSSQKMFILEIDSELGSGIYRLNHSAMDLILADLQMFRDFVKPFTFSGSSLNATIKDKVPGKIIRKGSFWVVKEPLEISIN
jgi:uncharacterized protein YoxC